MENSERPAFSLNPDDALIVVDVQNDFLPGGALGVPDGDQVVPVINEYLRCFERHGLPIFATRDWHPADHCSFQAAGGPWPPHCVAGTSGAGFPPELALPPSAQVISKAMTRDADAYSGFAGTDLATRLRQAGVSRLFVGGLTTDYCVLNTVKEAIMEGYTTILLADAVRAVNVKPGDDAMAIAEMQRLGATTARLKDIAA